MIPFWGTLVNRHEKKLPCEWGFGRRRGGDGPLREVALFEVSRAKSDALRMLTERSNSNYVDSNR